MTTPSDGFAVGSPLELVDRLTKLEERLSQVEAAVMYGPPSAPSQAAVDVAAQREITMLRKSVFVLTHAIRTHREAIKNPRIVDPDTADYELWQQIAEDD